MSSLLRRENISISMRVFGNSPKKTINTRLVATIMRPWFFSSWSALARASLHNGLSLSGLVFVARLPCRSSLSHGSLHHPWVVLSLPLTGLGSTMTYVPWRSYQVFSFFFFFFFYPFWCYPAAGSPSPIGSVPSMPHLCAWHPDMRFCCWCLCLLWFLLSFCWVFFY